MCHIYLAIIFIYSMTNFYICVFSLSLIFLFSFFLFLFKSLYQCCASSFDYLSLNKLYFVVKIIVGVSYRKEYDGVGFHNSNVLFFVLWTSIKYDQSSFLGERVSVNQRIIKLVQMVLVMSIIYDIFLIMLNINTSMEV